MSPIQRVVKMNMQREKHTRNVVVLVLYHDFTCFVCLCSPVLPLRRNKYNNYYCLVA